MNGAIKNTAIRAPHVSRLQRTSGVCIISTKRRENGTVLDDFRQEGAFKALFPRRARHTPFEAILINTSGGLTGGDKMSAFISVGEDTSSTISTQACEKMCRSLGDTTHVSNSLKIGAHAELLWCPQETILFQQSRVDRGITVAMEETSRAIIVEPIVFGRQAHGEVYCGGVFRDRWRVFVGKRLVHAEDIKIDASTGMSITRPAVLKDYKAVATILAIGSAGYHNTEHILDQFAGHENMKIGVSSWVVAGIEKTVIRLAAMSTYVLRPAIVKIVEHLSNANHLPKAWSI